MEQICNEVYKSAKKWRTLIDYALEMDYNGIAYLIKRSAQRDLLEWMTLEGFTHQGVDTS